MTGTYAPSAEGGTAFFSPRLPPLFLFARILAICVRLHDNRFQKRDCRCVDGVLCRTPEELFDLLLEDCLGFEEIQLTGGRRDPNRGDEAALEQLRQSYLAQYRKGEPK